MVDWNLYDMRLTARGQTSADRQTNYLQEDFEREYTKNPAYTEVIHNGSRQYFLVLRSEVPYRYKLVAPPNTSLLVGDSIVAFGEHWIVFRTRVADTVQITGEMWLCNHLFRWQNFNSDIIERWGVLDDGVYSSTLMGDDSIKSKNKQFKILLPLDDDTRKLYVDKRLAIDKVYDSFGNEILNVYIITGYDSVADNFGTGAHLLTLNIRSDEFLRDKDSIEHLICDYISADTTTTNPELLTCSITGSSYIRLGTNRKYIAKFFDIDGNEVSNITPVWTATPSLSGITAANSGNDFIVTVTDNESLSNQTITISLSDPDGLYNSSSISVDIINL